MKHEIHELANLFPMFNETEYEKLRDDIEKNGLLFPIVLYEDKILDGRNRNRACEELGIEPETEEYEGDYPLGYVLTVNLHRRHLNASQKAMIAAGFANMRQGERTDIQPSENFPKVSQKTAAELFGISDKLLRNAKKVLEEGTEEEIEVVRSGQKSVSAIVSAIKKRTEPQKPVKGNKQTQNQSQEKGRNEIDSETSETNPTLSRVFCQSKTNSEENVTATLPDDAKEDIVRSWLDSTAKVKRLLDLFEETLTSDQKKQELYKNVKRWYDMRVKDKV